MSKYCIALLICILQGCNGQLMRNPETTHISDVTDCLHSAEKKQSINIPIGAKDVVTSATVIEIPYDYDAGSFRLCMAHKGHEIADKKISDNNFMQIARSCLSEVQATENPNTRYVSCVQRGTVSVEPIINTK